jgi:hypothetical protein
MLRSTTDLTREVQLMWKVKNAIPRLREAPEIFSKSFRKYLCDITG